MFIDKKGRLFGKISIVDIAILLVVVLAVGGVGYKFTRSKTATPFTKPDTIIMQFYIGDVADMDAAQIETGMDVYDRVKQNYIGKITNVQQGPSSVIVYTADGRAVKTSKPDYSSLTITVEASGHYGNAGVTVGNSDYFTAEQNHYSFGNAKLYIKLQSIKKG